MNKERTRKELQLNTQRKTLRFIESYSKSSRKSYKDVESLFIFLRFALNSFSLLSGFLWISFAWGSIPIYTCEDTLPIVYLWGGYCAWGIHPYLYLWRNPPYRLLVGWIWSRKDTCRILYFPLLLS